MENKKLKMILNEIYVLIYKHVEEKSIGDLKEYIEMWSLVTKERGSTEERRFIRICPEKIEEDMLSKEKLIKKAKFSEEDIKAINKFVIACVAVIQYEDIEKKLVNVNIDKLYYQAALKQYYIENSLIHKENRFTQFSDEFKQVGTQIGAYYRLVNNSDNKEKLSNLATIIASKTSELFKRYNFNYSLPICCSGQSKLEI